MKYLSMTFLCLTAWGAVQAQTWNEEFLNQPFNVRYGNQNPVRIAHNAVHDFAVAHVEYGLNKGDFHAIDASGNAHSLNAYIGGLRRVGKVDVEGHLAYHNTQDKDQRWGNTLWNRELNPFVVVDTVAGDASTEAFDMHVAASYPFNDRWRGGLEVGLRTGSRADQTDPRPRTTTSQVPLTAGAEYAVSSAWTVGASAGVELFSSTIEHYTVQPLNNYRFFVMKGMGDYLKRSTGDDGGYRRDYTGTTWRGALEAVWHPADGKWQDALEVRFATGNEDAKDGGTSFEFHGGDYKEYELALKNRLQYRPSTKNLHELTLQAHTKNGEGTWYEQQRRTDTEHGNIAYYEVLSSKILHKPSAMGAGVSYEYNRLTDEGERNWYVTASVAAEETEQTHYTKVTELDQRTGTTNEWYEMPKQTIDLLQVGARVGKTFRLGEVNLLAQLKGGYVYPLTKKYATGTVFEGSDDISDAYVSRVFEYTSAERAHVGLLVDASKPVGKKLTAGLHVAAENMFYLDKEKYWQGYDGHSLTTVHVGAYLKF